MFHYAGRLLLLLSLVPQYVLTNCMGRSSTSDLAPQAVYLLSPSKKAKAHDTHKHAPAKKEPVSAAPLPVKDDEGTEVPAKEVAASAQAAFVRIFSFATYRASSYHYGVHLG